jgi:hypothetical protein
VDTSFELCWKCGTSPEGEEDPEFVRADDAPPIEDSLYDPVSEPAAAAVPGDSSDTRGSRQAGLVVCYQALTLMESKFLADQLSAQGIPALSDTQDMQDALGTWDGNPRVYCRAEDLPRARAWLEDYERRRKAEHGQGRSG